MQILIYKIMNTITIYQTVNQTLPNADVSFLRYLSKNVKLFGVFLSARIRNSIFYIIKNKSRN